MMHWIGPTLTRLGEWTAHPAAFGLVIVWIAAWLIFDARSFDFKAATEIIVLVLALFIVRADFRDTQATQAKLDKLLEGQGQGSEENTSLDEREIEEIVEHRQVAKSPSKEA